MHLHIDSIGLFFINQQLAHVAAFEKCSEQMKLPRGARACSLTAHLLSGWFMFGCVILWEVYCYPVYTNKLQNRQKPQAAEVVKV